MRSFVATAELRSGKVSGGGEGGRRDTMETN